MQQTPKPSRRVWRRRALSLLLALVMVLGLVPVFPVTEAAAHWADTYLTQLVEWGFIRADQANNPDRALTRADFMAIVNRAYGYHEEGETPFEDIKETDWFYDDVGIAYTARYINGTSPTTASPNNPLTRETAATILGRNMMLQESPGELVEFSDAHQISTWASGIIKSSMEHYLIGGYNDGTFRPRRNVSWGEMASMLTSLVGTPLQEPGEYSLGGVYGNVTITSPDVTLRDTVISGDLYISGGVGLGGIVLENVTVLGRIVACGTGQAEGGQSSILLRNVTADELLVDNLQDHYVSLRADGITEIGKTTVRTSAYIEDNTPDGMGLHYISLEGESYPEGEEPEDWVPIQLDLAGRIEEVVNRTPRSQVRVGAGTVAKLTVDETAEGSSVIIDRGAVVKELNLDTATPVTGQGDIEHLVVNAPGCEVEMLPDEIDIRPGVTAIIAGEEMDTVGAKESSELPMILAGYPQAQDVVPTGLDAAFMTNKAGTVYWAVTAITDGSIGEEDLIKPPSYGYLAVAHGSVKVLKGNEETISKVTGLTPGGSYYLSAILVDARGQRSTVKVISFTTPDNTVPAFCAGYPKMSKVSRTDSVVVVMPNKDCKLYYALLPEGATAPTENELKSNAVSGALGYGVRDVTKNVEDTFRVNDVILDEQTTYVLYLWLTDADGVNKGKIDSLKFTTDDETPPEFIVDPHVTKATDKNVTLTFRLNENGTVYWVAVPSGTLYPKPEPGTSYETAPLNSDYAKLQVSSGMNIGADGKSGKVTAKENADGTITVSGLQPEVTYDFYYLAKDNAGPDRNYSVTVKKITISTLDVNPPVITQSFELTSDPNDKTTRPTTDSDIYLDINENVKCLGKDGGTSFRELYDNVRNSSGSAQNAAISLWALNLYNAIKLNRTDGTVVRDIHERTSSYPADFKDSDYTIDYTQAYVTTNPDNPNGIRIVFPSEGLNLESGARYYFTITGLYDTSDNQNQIKPDPIDFTIPARRTEAIKQGHSVEPFDVAPPTVWFYTNPGVGSGDGPIDRDANGNLKEENVTDADGNVTGTRGVPETPDRYFRIDPSSTGSSNNSISYDILMWSNLASTDFSLYYRVIDPDKAGSSKILDENGKYPSTYTYTDPKTGKETEITDYLILPDGATAVDYANQTVDSNGWIWMGTNTVNNLPSSGWSAKSVNKTFNNCDPTNFPLLKNLNDHLEYEFVISLERFKGDTDRDIWSGEVDFQFDVIAGQSSVLEQVSSTLSMGRNYLKTNYIDKGLVSHISWWDQESQPTLELEWTRLAIGMPGFSSRRPTFSDFTHESVTLNVSLTSTGTIHYVVDLAKSTGGFPEIPTTRKVTEDEAEKIQAAIDAGTLDSSIWTTSAKDEIYLVFENLPEGVDPPPRNGIEAMPNWMKGVPEGTVAENGTVDNPREKYNMITSPNFDEVASYDDLWEGSAPVAHGSFSAGSSTPTAEIITGLQPDTDYYIYIVIDNDAGSTSHGYIYHFKTEKTPKPKVNIRPQTSDGTADVWTPDVDSKMKYVLFEESEAWGIELLKQPFADFVDTSGDFVPDGKEMPNCWGENWKPTDTDNRGDDVKGFTVLDALMTTYSNAAARSSSNASKAYIPLAQDNSVELYEGGYSVFDIYANDEIRQKVDALIRNFEGRGTAEVMRSGDWDYTASRDGVGNRQFEPPIAAGATYVLLVAGQRAVMGADDPGVDYLRDAFKANTKIYKTDGEAPELQDVPMASVTKNKQDSNAYDFTILLKFDKNLYNGDKKPISAEEFKKALLTVGDISDLDVTIPDPNTPASAFTIKGKTSTLPSGLMILNDENAQVIWNANHIPADEDLMIQFSELQVRRTEDDKQIVEEEYLTLTITWGEKDWEFEFVVNKTTTQKPTTPEPTADPAAEGPGAVIISNPVTPTGLTFSNVSGAKLSGSTMKMTGTSLSSTIKATISPSGATGTITWTSSNPKVASVVSSGTGGAQAKITGLTAGTATITAKVGSVERSFTVTVSPSVTISSFTANSTASTLTKGTDGTYTWTRKSGTSCAATLKFTTGMSLDNTTVKVTSSDTKAVSVGSVTKSGTTGQVQLTFGSMNTSGQVTITIKAGDVTQTFTIKLVGSDVSAVNIASTKK